MNPQPYELWYENFSGMIRMNERFDSYDRLALELFRSKKKHPLTVIEFGYTPPKSDWSKDRCFTQQLQWMADNEFANCLVITQDDRAPERFETYYKKVKVYVPSQEGPLPNYFKAVIHGVKLADADLIVLAEEMRGVFDFEALKPGCLVIAEPNWELSGKNLLTKIIPGVIPIWRKT
jgi:hypothetical protein